MQGQPPPGQILPFQVVESLHYARFVVLESDDGSDPLLAFCTNYDGPEGDDRCSRSRARRRHLEDLTEHAGAGLERVFEHCRGYRSGHFAAYFDKHDRKASTFYVGSSGRSRNQILWEAELRRKVEGILDAVDFSKTPAEGVRQTVLERLSRDQVTVPAFPPSRSSAPRLPGRR